MPQGARKSLDSLIESALVPKRIARRNKHLFWAVVGASIGCAFAENALRVAQWRARMRLRGQTVRALLDNKRVREVLASLGWKVAQERHIDTADGPLILAEDSCRTVQQTLRRTWLRLIMPPDPFLSAAENCRAVETVDLHTDAHNEVRAHNSTSTDGRMGTRAGRRR